MIDVKLGDRVYLLKPGTDKVEYAAVLWVGLLPPEHVGPSAGPFAGIQFDNPVGKGNGSLGSTKYFVAREGYAAFVPAHMLHKVQADSHSLFSASYSPPSASSSSSSPPNDYYRQNGGGDDFDYSNGFSSPHLNNVGGGGGGNSINGVVSDISRPAFMAPIGTRPGGGVVGGGGGYSAFDGLSSSPYLKSAYAANPAPYSNGASPAKAAMNGGDAGAANTPAATKNDDEVFESDDEIDEALKVDAKEITALTNKFIKMASPTSSEMSVSSKAATPEKKPTKTQNNNIIGGKGASASPARSPTPPPPVVASSQEWSVVASKIKKAPKQVRDALKAPEKKAAPVVKSKSKTEKLMAENPKYKSTLCNWYMQGARCPNGNECHFAHGESEMRVLARPKYKYKTQVCSYYAAGHCGNGSTCHFAHGLADLQK